MRLLYQSFAIINLLKDNNKPVGGAAVEWFTWIKAFRILGCEFGVITQKGISTKIKKENNFDILESFELNKGIPKLRLFTYRIPILLKVIKKYNPDFIIQGCATENTGILAFIALLLNKPFIHRVGSDMDVDGRVYKDFFFITKYLHKFGLARANHISCQNQYQYKKLREKFPNKSISILHNPYFFNKYNFENNTKEYIAWIGNFRYEKNLPALAEIAKKLPQYSFKIAGTKFHTTDEDTIKGLEILEKLANVEFVGHNSNDLIPEFLSKAYCLLNTSRLEGFSNTFLEAWAVGVPVVSTKNVNPDYIITTYKLGIITDNYEEIPKKIDQLISDQQYKNFSQRCIDYVKEKHDPVKLAQKFLNEMINSTSTK